MYDAYVPLVERAGGVARFVRLKPPDWRITAENLAEAFTPRTRVVLFNNPLNPAGVVHGVEELTVLAHACMAHDSIAICDEVWEHVVFDGRRHTPLIALPGMRERTVKIGSAGKIFSLTGWKVGFVCAPLALMRVLAKAHQYITFTTPPNLQAAVAYGLAKDDSYFAGMRAGFQRSRDRFAAGLGERGFSVLPSAGTYFLNIDIAPITNEDDATFCQRLVREHGVAAIPVSAFYAENHVTNVVRFCFAKTDATLDAALQRLERVAR
jgi:aspartate/methionine/tyrosine aminotransferase